MNKNDKYFMNLVRSGKIEIDYKTGIVYSRLSGKLKPVGALQSSGYLHMSAGPTRKERHYIQLHRLIWISVHGEIPKGYEPNHKNGIKTDNRLSNLEITTRSDNVRHAHYKLGKIFGIWSTTKHGKRITKEQTQQVIDLYQSGITNQSEIARRTGIRRPTVNRIVHSM